MAANFLPVPVARYLRLTIPSSSSAPVLSVTLSQRGSLRTDPRGRRWMAFTASHVAAPGVPRFVWRARVNLFPLLRLSIIDSLIDGVGSGCVSLLGIKLSSAEGTPEMHSGALYRYLAEAVWYPTALVPSERLTWTAIDDRRARATLTDGGQTVSLEFRFLPTGEVSEVFTAGRWGHFAGKFLQRPWEGHFSDYRRVGGFLIPFRGEVGWYVDGGLGLVWRGTIDDARSAS